MDLPLKNRCYASQLRCCWIVLLGLLSCLLLFAPSVVHGAGGDAGWNLPPKSTAVVTGGTKGIGKVCMAQYSTVQYSIV